jgi:hypothetical protein
MEALLLCVIALISLTSANGSGSTDPVQRVANVTEGDIIRLDCVPTTEEQTAAWRQVDKKMIISVGQMLITRSYGDRVRVHGNYTLEIKDAIEGDTGEYLCEIPGGERLTYRLFVEKKNVEEGMIK